jgi:hypothetical protein
MNATARETSDRYEKVHGNVLRMKPIGRYRRRVLTPYGKFVVACVGILLVFTISLAYHMLK